MEVAIQEGSLIAPDFVLIEIERKEDQLYEWAKTQEGFFIASDAEIQLIQKEIINNFPKLIDNRKNRSMCDPWVIALAKQRGCNVVTEEHRSRNRESMEKNPKIPDVCDSMGITCIKTVDLIEKMKWSF
jgi:hypothetical protein